MLPALLRKSSSSERRTRTSTVQSSAYDWARVGSDMDFIMDITEGMEAYPKPSLNHFPANYYTTCAPAIASAAEVL